jgi:hypothetical protein
MLLLSLASQQLLFGGREVIRLVWISADVSHFLPVTGQHVVVANACGHAM